MEVIKLGVQPSESAFAVDCQDSKGGVLENKYTAGVIVRVDAVQYSRWSLYMQMDYFYTNSKSQGSGDVRLRKWGAYKDSKHKIRRQ